MVDGWGCEHCGPHYSSNGWDGRCHCGGKYGYYPMAFDGLKIKLLSVEIDDFGVKGVMCIAGKNPSPTFGGQIMSFRPDSYGNVIRREVAEEMFKKYFEKEENDA